MSDRLTPGPRILLVDSAQDEREMYAEWFSSLGYCTLQAATAFDGYRLAAELHPDAVVTDAHLSGGQDGLWLVARLREATDTHDIPVVMIAAPSSRDGFAGALRAGCDSWLEKPCPPDRLADEVKALIQSQVR
ncbi:MAG TPA: response regulator [Vicinamibacterales bacterium]|nr:response regulator [Vicinamibacterales bacterium]